VVLRKQVTEWRRLHAIEPAVTLRVITSPIGGWIVSIDGWTAPPHFHFPRAHPDIESAQRAADDVLINYRPHDCKQCGCGEWVPIVGAGCRRGHAHGTLH
jgi:hypothetical protein